MEYWTQQFGTDGEIFSIEARNTSIILHISYNPFRYRLCLLKTENNKKLFIKFLIFICLNALFMKKKKKKTVDAQNALLFSYPNHTIVKVCPSSPFVHVDVRGQTLLHTTPGWLLAFHP